jgi:hypothetical protein
MPREVEICWEPNRTLVTTLARTGTRFIVIGSTAVKFHVPQAREPNDLDLFVEPTMAAIQDLNAAMAPLGGPSVNATPEHLAKANTGFPAKGTHGLNVDVFVTAEGFDFAEHWTRAEEATVVFTTTVVRVASIPTLRAWLRRALRMEPARTEQIQKDLESLDAAERQKA